MASASSVSTAARCQSEEWPFGQSTKVIVALALIAGLVLRFWGFGNPPFDAHAFRQTQTLATIEDFYWGGVDFFYPTTNYAGHPGILVLEAPVFQVIAAALYHLFGPHLEVIRALNIVIGAGTTLALYAITARLLNRRTALLSALIYWLAPLNILFERSTLFDPMAVLFALLSFYEFLVLLRPRAEGKLLRQPRTLAALAGLTLTTCLVAVMKPLYLWPSVLLAAWEFARRRFRFEREIALAAAVFFVSGVLFLAWNRHCYIANRSGYYRDLDPSSLLGIKELFDPKYYWTLMKTRYKEWLGAFGMILYPMGLWAAWKRRKEKAIAATLWLLALIPPTYLCVFANINFPHNYYQLIITPFLAIIAAVGFAWLASFLSPDTGPRPIVWNAGLVALILAAPFAYLIWKNPSKPVRQMVAFQELCAGCFAPRSPGIVFVSADIIKTAGGNVDNPLPEYLYGAGFRGFGRAVESPKQAHQLFGQMLPYCHDLRYVIFWGLKPGWFEAEKARVVKRDDKRLFYAFELTGPPK